MPSFSVEESFKKLIDVDPDADGFQNLSVLQCSHVNCVIIENAESDVVDVRPRLGEPQLWSTGLYRVFWRPSQPECPAVISSPIAGVG